MVRLKTRYLLIEILYPDELLDSDLESKAQVERSLRSSTLPNVDSRKLLKLLKQSVEVNFGDLGLGYIASTIAGKSWFSIYIYIDELNLQVKYFSSVTSTGILRVSRDHIRLIWAALSYISQIDSRKVVINVIRVSGTIKKCEKAAIRRNKSCITNQISAISRFEVSSEHESDIMEEL